MLILLINETKPLAGLFASTTGGIGSVPDISVADEGQAVSVQTFTRMAGVITDSFVAGDVLHIGIGDGVNAPVCYIELSSASPATGTMAINTVGMVALFAATVANRLSLQVGVVRTRGGYTNTIFSAPIVIHRSVIDPDTAVPTPSILGDGVAAALQVAINTALGFVRLDASARLPAVDGSQLTNVPNELPSQTGNSGKYLTTNGTAASWGAVTGGVTSITGTANEITVTGTTTPTLSLPSALTFTGKTVTGGTFTGGAFNGTVGATTPSTVAGTTGTFSGAVTGSTFNAINITRGLLSSVTNIGIGLNALSSTISGSSNSTAIGSSSLANVTNGTNNTGLGASTLTNMVTGGSNTAVGSNSMASATGGSNTAVGVLSLANAAGNRNVGLGYSAGRYETGSDSLYIDNQDRTDTAGDKAKALLYGTFAATASAQQLTINAGTVTLNGSAVTAASYSGAGTGLTGTAASLTAGNVTTIPALSGAITNTGNATVLGSFTMSQLSTAVSDGDPAYVGAANTFTGTTNTFTLPTTTGTTTTSGIAVAGNSLTTGTGIYAASSTLTSGKLLDLQVSGTAAAAGHTALNIGMSGANATSGITTTGLTVSNTRTGTTSVNSGGKFTATGGATNYAAEFVTDGSSGVVLRLQSQYTSASLALGTTTYTISGCSPTASNGSLSFSIGGGSVSTITTLGTGSLQFPSGTFTGALITTPQALSGAGAVNVTTAATAFTSTGAAQALTLANGTAGQLKTISHVVDGGSGVLTPTTCSGFTTITFTNVGDSVILQYHTTAGWCIVGVFGAVPA